MWVTRGFSMVVVVQSQYGVYNAGVESRVKWNWIFGFGFFCCYQRVGRKTIVINSTYVVTRSLLVRETAVTLCMTRSI